ncbi:zinc-ribbon domain-containing protein [Maribacter sp. 2307ULW6-5]|uniref:zinc-ribbon domain-containing protein n=1 Tax=Maribacter sp. 2307ULW6-5 TaxID=3386275 RepID=UPI0039BC4A41
MIYFFGTRSSVIKERKLDKTVCPYCQTPNSFVVRTYGKYFHFFWIPLLPFFKTHVAACSHCKKSYAQREFTPDMQRALARANTIDPAKRPLWQGCGCLILFTFFAVMLSISFYGVYVRSQGQDTATKAVDPRMELLLKDMAQMERPLRPDTDSLSVELKACLDHDIVGGLDTRNIGYFTKKEGNKVLVLLKVANIKAIKPEFRKDILDVVTDCLGQMGMDQEGHELYLGVEGRWNTVLVKTPTEADLGGRYGDKAKLLPFYGDPAPLAPETPATDSPINE